jgi:hypothetical protein
LAPSNLSLTSPQSAGIDDVPEVLERSEFRLSDVKPSVQGIPSKGILVKLFLVSRKDTGSADDSERTVWVVSSPDAIHWTPRKSKDAHKTNARATDKAFHAAKAWPAFKPRMKAKLSGGKAGRQKERRSSAVGGRSVAEQPVQEGRSQSDDTSDEQEEEEEEAEEGEEEDDSEEDDAGEDGAGEDGALEDGAVEDVEESLKDSEGEENMEGEKEEEEEEEAMLHDESEHDTEEQDDDGHNISPEEAEAGEADKREHGEHEVGEDLAEDIGEEREQGAEGQQEAEREGEREEEDKTSDEIEPQTRIRGKDRAVQDGEEEEHGDDSEMGEEQGDNGNVEGVRDSTEQQVTENNRDGVWRSWKVKDTNGKEDEERCTNACEEEKMAEDENGSADARRKRPLEKSEALRCSTPEERPNKRSKGDGGENVDGAATNDSPVRTVSPETTPRPKTSSPTLITTSPGSTIEIVRQTSVVPGLQCTEKAVWDAAQRDSIISSLPHEQQTKMIHAALSLGSKEGIKALKCFVNNARKDGRRRRENLHSDFDLIALHSGVDVWHSTSVLVSRDSSLARFSDLYRQIDTLDNKVTLFSITKRVKLAAMAQYRKSLLQEGAGRNQAKDANLHLFRAVYPDHATIETPDDKETSSTARDDWNRLRDRLREGRMWLEVRDLFGGVGAFLALPPQCVPDRHVLRMPARNFGSWLRLLEIAWRALDTHARHTLNDLVRMSLAGQRLPEDVLVLETLENGFCTAPTSLSDILTGWSSFERKSRDGEGEPTTPTHREEDGDAATSGPASTTTSTTNRPEGAEGLGMISRQVRRGDVDDELLKDLNFDDGLSQEI